MNPANNILSIVSIRQANLHIDPETGEAKHFPSINQAKAYSRKLGGAGKVRALKGPALKEFRKEYLLTVFNGKLETIRKQIESARVDVRVANEAHNKAFDTASEEELKKLLEAAQRADLDLEEALSEEVDCLAKLSEIRKGNFS